jgi:hypothetical protein
LSNAQSSSDDSSSPFVENVSSSPSIEHSSPDDSSHEHLIRHSHHIHQPPDYYSPFTVAALSESASCNDVILHLKWLRKLLLLSGPARGILCHVPHIFLITCKWI